MDATVNYIANCISGSVDEKHPYFDFDDEYDEFSSNKVITSRLVEILKVNYLFSNVSEIEIDDPKADHICTIKIVHNDIEHRFTIEIYSCSRGYKYLNVTI